MKKLLSIVLGGVLGVVPGVLVAWGVWGPLREWLFNSVPADVQWAFLAKVAICVTLFFTVGGGLVAFLVIIGGVLGLKIAGNIVNEQ